MADQVDVKRVKDIKIKSGVVKRLAKEKVMYEVEAEKSLQKLEKMKVDDPEDYMIRKQQELLEESRMMIPDCKRRLVAAWDDLHKMIENDDDLQETEEYKAAKLILDETRAQTGR